MVNIGKDHSKLCHKCIFDLAYLLVKKISHSFSAKISHKRSCIFDKGVDISGCYPFREPVWVNRKLPKGKNFIGCILDLFVNQSALQINKT